MRLKLFTSWIFRGWIVGLLLILYAKIADLKGLCSDKQYLQGSTCCNKCEPGSYVFSDCTDTTQTICRPCSDDEYQPGWTSKKSCIQHKYCDEGKGFMKRPINHVTEEPCPCLPNFKCSPINCEYCEKIPTCGPGYELESPNGKTCVPCKTGFFSKEDSADQCKQWTDCKAQGRTETHPGSAEVDVECGQPEPGAAPSWFIVSMLSVITVLCLVILLLFCYKDKMKLLSVNLRSCVQNLKRTRIQQETLAPLYHSGGTGGILGSPKCTPCETTKLVCQVPLTPTNELLCPTSPQDVKISLPFTIQMPETEGARERAVSEDLSERSGEPEEVSEDEEPVNALAASCVCVVPVQEPLEVGENEDCSQAVNPGTLGACSCGGSDGEERKKEETSETEKETDSTLSRHETAVSSLVSFPPSVPKTFSGVYPSSPLSELCLTLSQAETKLDFKPRTDKSLEEQYKLKCTDSTFIDSGSPSVTSAVTSVGPLMTSSFVGDLYQDKPPEYSNQGMSCEENRAPKLSSEASEELECTPESLQSQLVEPTLTSGQVSGNHNTTFISSGQVMNLSGDVIVVYVSQTSLGNDGVEPDNAFGSPVQEQAEETALFLQSSLTEDSITHSTLQEQTLPIQEMMEERSPEKRKSGQIKFH